MRILGARQKHKKPLGEDGGLCPAVMLPPWSYKSELLTPKRKPNTPSSQKVTILTKAINIDKQPVLWISFYHGFDGFDGFACGRRIDQKVCCFPWAYALAA